MKQNLQLLFFATLFLFAFCTTPRSAVSTKDDGRIEVVFVQVNDVYEIAPVAGGKEGGMARVATLKKQYKQANPNTFLVMSGDFVSPSVYNSLQYEGKRIRGAQMIESMNAAAMDIVVFGNHEFDVSEKELQDRINESTFTWVSTNTYHKMQDSLAPFARTTRTGTQPFPETYIINAKDADGTTAKIGVIGITLPSNPADFVFYKDPIVAAKQAFNALKDSVDAVVAITHQAVQDDIILAKELPGLAAILGGHEHEMVFNKTGKVYITKAHSNARSAYALKLNINKSNHEVTVPLPSLTYLNQSIAVDSATNVVVEKWKKIAEDNYASLGFDPRKVVLQAGEALDGRETEIRSRSTNLSNLITAAMAFASPDADVVLFNSGSIRLDDILTPPVTQYDIIRTLPFGGGIREVDMTGDLLAKVLQVGAKNINNGGFLQTQPVTFDNATNSFTVNNQSINPAKIYRVALTDFLLSGKETNLAFLNEKNPGIVKVYPAQTAVTNPQADIRAAIVMYLASKK
jgi:2',3'-cyclic-nucleotide 2'-phosphodiesterase (5'-nucleotidase family)